MAQVGRRRKNKGVKMEIYYEKKKKRIRKNMNKKREMVNGRILMK